MPIKDIEKGMQGIGKTVVSGVKIEEFDIKILGILEDRSPSGDLILAKVSGPLIDKSGGIAAGMSGSPVYIDGKLVGAIGYTWGLTDHTVGLITPIESMLDIFKLNSVQDSERDIEIKEPEKKEISFSNPIKIDDREFSRINFAKSYMAAKELATESGTLVAYPAKTPLMVNGINGRALDNLMEDLGDYDLVPVKTGTAGSTGSENKVPLEPGSAIAVQMVRGDVNVSAIGTLTYKENNQILGFGHPFLQLGQVEYFLSGAEILTIIDQMEMPFKLGMPSNPAGTITQDRNAGVGGRLDQLPEIIPVNVEVIDKDLNQKEEIEFQVIQDEELVVSLITNSTLQAIDAAIDRRGYGTAEVEIGIMADKLPDNIFEYNNMYFSNNDVAASSITDFYNLLNLIVTNPFEKVDLISLDYKVTIERKRQVAIIEEVELLNKELYPGDTAEIEVTLRPYRKEPFKTIYQVKIPENIQTGEASLTVSGGMYGTNYQVESAFSPQEDKEDESYIVGEHYKSLDSLLEDYAEYYRNNQLVVDILPYYVEVVEDTPAAATPADSQAKSEESETETKSENDPEPPIDEQNNIDKVEEIFDTDYILEGGLTLEITILEKQDSETEESTESTTPPTNKVKAQQ